MAMVREDSIFLTNAYRCRCGHEWANKSFRNAERPRVCPKCKSANWDRPYKFRRSERGVQDDATGGTGS